jgi:KDO2-lipid IV(A) lauroyltransferase
VGRERASQWWTYQWWNLAWRATRLLPEPVAALTYRSAADVAWARRGAPVRQLEANLAQVLADTDATPGEGEQLVRALSRQAMRSYLRYWMETFRLPDWSADRIRSSFVLDNESLLDAELAAGHGVVLAMPHMANWDLGAAWASQRGIQVTTVAERLRPERLYQQFLTYRQALGLEVLPLAGADHDVLSTLADRLRRNRLVPLLADRDLLGSGVPVRFLGRTARLPPGPALLSVRTGAPLRPLGMWYAERDVRVHLYDAVQDPGTGTTRQRVTAMTQQVADAFSDAIRRHPTDWHMLQPVWDRDGSPAPPPGSSASG